MKIGYTTVKEENESLSQLENTISKNLGKNYKVPFIPEVFQHIGNEEWNERYTTIVDDDGITWIKVSTEGKLNGENWLGTTDFYSRNQVLNIFDLA